MNRSAALLLCSLLCSCSAHQTICTPGYAARRRPPEWYTEIVKHILAAESHRQTRCCELDHIIPLELGGAAWSWSNLQLQPWAAARRKDRAENGLHRLVCRGQMPLAQARQIMLRWKD